MDRPGRGDPCSMFIGNGRLIASDRIEGAIPRKPNRSSILWSGFLECDGAIHTYLPLARARFSEATSPPLVDSTRYWGGTPHSASRDSDACLCFDWGTEMEIDEECLGSEPREKCGPTRYAFPVAI